jgi:MerR family copper efflux transcriptional regulator
MGRQALLIGEVAAKSGLSRKALRLYEAAGILAPPTRTHSGYRLYDADTLALLTFVTRARRLGLTLAEIREVVAIRRAGRVPCPHVRTLIERKARELSQTLRALRGLLASWRAQGNGVAAAVCPHIEAKGGEVPWNRFESPSARRVARARKSSSTTTVSTSARPGTVRS